MPGVHIALERTGHSGHLVAGVALYPAARRSVSTVRRVWPQWCCNTPSFAIIAHEALHYRAKGCECRSTSIPISMCPTRCRKAGNQPEVVPSSTRYEIALSFVSYGGCVPAGGKRSSNRGIWVRSITLNTTPVALPGSNSFPKR